MMTTALLISIAFNQERQYYQGDIEMKLEVIPARWVTESDSLRRVQKDLGALELKDPAAAQTFLDKEIARSSSKNLKTPLTELEQLYLLNRGRIQARTSRKSYYWSSSINARAMKSSFGHDYAVYRLLPYFHFYYGMKRSDITMSILNREPKDGQLLEYSLYWLARSQFMFRDASNYSRLLQLARNNPQAVSKERLSYYEFVGKLYSAIDSRDKSAVPSLRKDYLAVMSGQLDDPEYLALWVNYRYMRHKVLGEPRVYADQKWYDDVKEKFLTARPRP